MTLLPWFNKPQNNHLEIYKNTVNTSFMILIKINKVRNFKGLLVPKNFACKNDAKFLRTPAFF